VLLVGPAAAALEADPELAAYQPARYAESLLEAVLIAENDAIILADVAAEADQLDRAVASLRQVSPAATIILLCAPEDEPATRAAMSQGANDYLLVPIRAVELRAALGGPGAKATAPAAAAVAAVAVADGRARSASSHPTGPATPAVSTAPAKPAPGLALPLDVHAQLTQTMLDAPDELAERAVAYLNEHLPWPATVRFTTQVAADDAAGSAPVATGSPAACAVSHPAARAPFGVLTAGDDSTLDLAPEVRRQLEQAAAWLAGYLVLQRRSDQLRSLAITDELTGAYNRRYFNRFASALLDKARQQHFRVSVLLFDIDNFKQYNDQHGHAAGDEILRQAIALLRRCTRPNDLVARIGGDEFAVVFWDAEPPRQPNSQHPRDALAVSARFRKAIEEHDWRQGPKLIGSVSISGGIATFPWDAASLGALLSKADEALLRAKTQGKNVICLSDPDGKAEMSSEI
jgi:diguanylate cyclase (GGDEF)-like protein